MDLKNHSTEFSPESSIAINRCMNLLGKDVSGTGLGVFTSGGDSQGMNAALRAVVRSALYFGCRVYMIHEGYQGLVDGGEQFQEANWTDVNCIIHLGGTIIGSARCQDFRERPGRLKAAKNLVERGIQKLVVIGGDGSLTGANLFREEWPTLLQTLEENREISANQREKCSQLSIIGLVGSIDNDFCGTEMTIGTDSALHRIVEAVDNIVFTASSHKRTFIMEVMGRNCGFIALVAAIAVEADFIFIPEDPPKVDWPQTLTAKLKRTWQLKQRLNIIILSEGAMDCEGKHITAEDVRQAVVKETHHDTRITVLGHVQRGGAPSAFDRSLGSRMGIEAVMAVLKAEPNSEPQVVGLVGNSLALLPLMECVKTTQMIGQRMLEKDWKKAQMLRGKNFQSYLNVYHHLRNLQPEVPSTMSTPNQFQQRFAILHVGAPCGGMNGSVSSFVRSAILGGHKVFGVHDGIEGLAEGRLQEMSWGQVRGWVSKGGACLGTKRTLPDKMYKEIAGTIKMFNITGIAFVGGFGSYMSCLQFYHERKNYPEFRIPMIVLPATISNDVPGSELSLGADTALNELTEACDKMHQSGQGTQKRVFIAETQGYYCGYLATLAGLAGACEAAYIFEEKIGIDDLCKDMKRIAEKIESGIQLDALILRNENANVHYNTDFLARNTMPHTNKHRLYSEEGAKIFTTRSSIIGHVQQGGNPSVLDRNLSIKMGVQAYTWLAEQAGKMINKSADDLTRNSAPEATVIGVNKSAFTFTSVETLSLEIDFEHKLWRKAWWMSLREAMKILAMREAVYRPEARMLTLKELLHF